MFTQNRRLHRTGKHFVLVLLTLSWANATVLAAGADELDRTGTLWAPYLEWSLENPSWPGNPFDLEAIATFVHKESGEQRTTPMFYDLGNTWKFRFTATRSGSWSVRTSSAHAALDGKRGTVTVQTNPDAGARGFIVAHGNKYAWQIGSDRGRDLIPVTLFPFLRAFVPNVYMNYRKFGNRDQCGWTAVSPTFSDPDMLQAYLDEAEEHGCNGIQALICNQWFAAGAASSRDHNSRNPDPETFAALEQTIVAAHRRGMFLHIWAWGDEARGWTPIGVGGINAEPDRRVQRYIAARLGPLPGWMMSYGFDLNEWVRPEQVVSWAEYLDRHNGFPLMLCARETQDGNSFRSPGNLPVASHDDRLAQGDSEEQSRFYRQARYRLSQTPLRPAFFERRFSYLRDGFWDMGNTRRAFWQFTLAGGAGSIWGHYPPDCSAFVEGDYPNPEQLRTHRQFWRERFLMDMKPANDLSGDGDTLVLRSGSHAVFYREDAESIRLDLQAMDGPQPAVAVDTTKEYTEIDVGTLEPAERTWRPPYRSDWALAVGAFGD